MPALWIPKRLVEIGLINTACASPENFVCHCEIEYESRVIAAAAEAKSSNCKIIMLTGPSASGKTTTSIKFAEAIQRTGTHAEVISLDNFYRNAEDYPKLPDGSMDYENIHALDIEEIHRCLRELITKGESNLPLFDFEIERRKAESSHTNLQGGVAIVEGIHALNPLLTNVLPEGSVYKVYAGLREEYSKGGQRFLSTRDIRLARRMVRDNKYRGKSLLKTMMMWPKVCEGEDIYIKLFKPYADLLIDTSFSYEIAILAPFITEMKGTLHQHPVFGPQLDDLANRFEKISRLGPELIPPQSMLREFIG